MDMQAAQMSRDDVLRVPSGPITSIVGDAPDLRTNPSQEEGTDEDMDTQAAQVSRDDVLHVPSGSITRSRARQMQVSLQAFVQAIKE